ncbi:MAG: hypothetical protein JXJ22_10980 [Bacteroidales bacterium]|nr:hypothetical protein [Bacteroidales bacterium]
MKKLYTTLCWTVLICSGVFAQVENQYIQKPFQITFVYPLGTNGYNSYQCVNLFSLNMLVGISAGLNGAEFSGLLNIEKDFVTGVQFAGFGNIAGGDVNAGQFAGFLNVNGGNTKGVQGAGFLNLSGGYGEVVQMAGFGNAVNGLQGVQLGGFGNISTRPVVGAQLSGFGNISGGDSENVQLAGFGNIIAGDNNGLQASGFVNVARDIKGAQIAGFINIARKVEGVQIAGFINICDSIDGIPIGIVNIVKQNGYRKFEVGANETFFINTSFKLGIKSFYTIFSLGYRPKIHDQFWGYGLGLGTSLSVSEKNTLDIEAQVYDVQQNFFRNYKMNLLVQSRINFSYQIAEHLVVFAGPSFNLLISDRLASSEIFSPSWKINIADRDNHLRGWVGFNLGLRF